MKLSRRDLLKGLGAGAALLPMLEADFARGATNPFPKRLVVCVWTNGVQDASFYPSGGDLATATFPRVTAPLKDLRDSLIVMGGVDMKNFNSYGDHGAGHESFASTFLGKKGKEIQDGGARFVGGAPSVDQYVANELVKKGVKTPFTTLDTSLVVENYWHQSRCFFRGADAPVNGEQNPKKLFDALFTGRTLPAMGGTAPAADGAKLAAERKSILDFVGGELQAFGGKLGRDDKERVQAHLDSIRELEKQIGSTPATPGGGAGGCAAPTLEELAKPADNNNYPKLFDQHADLIVAALKCDLTRVVTFQTNTGNGTKIALNWLDVPSGVEFGAKNYHGVAHAGGNGKDTHDAWLMERFARFLQKMKDTKEGDSNMLDNSVVLIANHMGNGGGHDTDNLAWILAGKAQGYFKTGRMLKKARKGVSTTAILKAICASMDVDPAGFGDGAFGDALAELRA